MITAVPGDASIVGKVFISYRRKDSNFAHRLQEKLSDRLNGTVFVDLNIALDDFVQALESEVHTCDVFVLVVTDNTFDPVRIQQPDDWIRREVALALALNKPVALAIWETTRLPEPTTLPLDLRTITNKQGISLYATLFEEATDKLARHIVSISKGTIELREPEKMPRQLDNIPTIRAEISSVQNSTVVAGVSNSTVNIGGAGQEREAQRKRLMRQKRDLEDQLFETRPSAVPSSLPVRPIPLVAALAAALIGIGLLVSDSAAAALLGFIAAGVIGFAALRIGDRGEKQRNTQAALKAKIAEIEDEIHKLE